MKNAKRNWKTTMAGILTLLLCSVSVWQDPAKAADPGVLGAIAGGIGLIAAKDGDKSGLG